METVGGSWGVRVFGTKKPSALPHHPHPHPLFTAVRFLFVSLNLGCVDANSWAVWIFNRKTPGWPSFNPAWNLMSQQLRLQPSGYIRTSYRYTTIIGFETRIWCLVDVWQFALSSNDGPELLHPATIGNHQPCFQATTQPPTSIRTQLFGRSSSPWRSPRFCSSSSVHALVLARVRGKPLFSLTWKCVCLKKSPKRSDGLPSA